MAKTPKKLKRGRIPKNLLNRFPQYAIRERVAGSSGKSCNDGHMVTIVQHHATSQGIPVDGFRNNIKIQGGVDIHRFPNSGSFKEQSTVTDMLFNAKGTLYWNGYPVVTGSVSTGTGADLDVTDGVTTANRVDKITFTHTTATGGVAVADDGSGDVTVTISSEAANSGDITAVTLTGDSGGAMTASSGDAAFTIEGGTGASTAGSGTTLTVTNDDHAATVANTSGVATNVTNIASTLVIANAALPKAGGTMTGALTISEAIITSSTVDGVDIATRDAVLTTTTAATVTNAAAISLNTTHRALTDEHIDWTADQGGTNIHAGNYTDTNTQNTIDDTPANGVTDESISSNWAYDHNAATGNSAHVPSAGSSGQFLKHDGTWGTPSGTSYSFGDGVQESGGTVSVDLASNSGVEINSGEIRLNLGASSINGTLAAADGGTSLTSTATLLNANTTLSDISDAGDVAGEDVVPANKGGTGTTSNTDGAVLIGAGTGDVESVAMSSGKVLIGQAGSANPSAHTISGDISITTAGVSTVNQVDGGYVKSVNGVGADSGSVIEVPAMVVFSGVVDAAADLRTLGKFACSTTTSFGVSNGLDLDNKISTSVVVDDNITGLSTDVLAAACNIVAPSSSSKITGLSGQFSVTTIAVGGAGAGAVLTVYMSIYQASDVLSGNPTQLTHILSTSSLDLEITGNSRFEIEYFEFAYSASGEVLQASKPLAIILTCTATGADYADFGDTSFTGTVEMLTQ